MDPHPSEARRPVDPRQHDVARRRKRRIGRHAMENLRAILAVPREDDGTIEAAEHQRSRVARLTAALRVEYGAVEHDVALLDLDDPRLHVPPVGVRLIEKVGHGRALERRVSHAGTGSFLAWRNTGL